ncbi:MAG: glycosyltransferase family 2 protein [Clostridia bacterium]|nr:glycosyltransferase family 2 protein [Clostridia bacterium]
MKLSVVIPMYNESSIVEGAVRALDAAMAERLSAGDYQLIFVSDGSTDGCADMARAMTAEHPALRVMEYTPNRGKGCAVRTGILAAEGDFVLFTDCDLAYGTDLIFDFLARFEEGGCDVIIGSRPLGGYDGYPFLRKLMSKTYLKVVSVAAGFKHSDSQAGIKGFSQKAAKAIFGECEENGFAFDLEALMEADRQGYKVAELPAVIVNHRESKVRPIHDAMNMLRQVRKIQKRQKAKKKNR